MMSKCPGSQNFRQPKPEMMKCPFCSAQIEMWSDEAKTKCPECKREIIRSGEQTCLDWCKFAKDCLGESLYGKYTRNKAITIKHKLIIELEEYFGSDKKRIDHATKVLEYAEELLKEGIGEWHIVVPAGLLHDVGIKVAEEKYGSSESRYQEEEGAGIAKKMLLKYGLKKSDIDEICDIIAHHHSPGVIDTVNFKVLYDADMLVNLGDIEDVKDKEKLKTRIPKLFLTENGKRLAEKIYLS